MLLKKERNPQRSSMEGEIMDDENNRFQAGIYTIEQDYFNGLNVTSEYSRVVPINSPFAVDFAVPKLQKQYCLWRIEPIRHRKVSGS